MRGVKIAIHGPAPGGPEKDRGIHINQVTDRYFETTGIRLLLGRAFTRRDQSGSLVSPFSMTLPLAHCSAPRIRSAER